MVPLDRAHGLTTGTLTTGTLALIFSVIAVFFAFKAKGEEDSLEGIFEAVFAFAAFVACAITLAVWAYQTWVPTIHITIGD